MHSEMGSMWYRTEESGTVNKTETGRDYPVTTAGSDDEVVLQQGPQK